MLDLLKMSIKLYVVINNSLGMDKGKLSRVCVTAGFGAKQLITFRQKMQWFINRQTTIVLKANEPEFSELVKYLEDRKIKHISHFDAGYTQVPQGSLCMVAFFHEGNEYLDKFKLL